MRKIEYLNRSTGEITESHKEACRWYNAGDEVEVQLNGVTRCYWAH